MGRYFDFSLICCPSSYTDFAFNYIAADSLVLLTSVFLIVFHFFIGGHKGLHDVNFITFRQA